MNSFNIKRFARILSWYMRVNMQRLLMWTIGTALVVFVGEMLMLSWGFSSSAEMMNVFTGMQMAGFVIVMLLMFASVTMPINKKGKRETFLMLPATNLEKYFTLVIFSSVICVLCIFAALAFGDSLRVGIMWLKEAQGGSEADICHWWDSTLPKLFENLPPSLVPIPNTTYTIGLVTMHYLSIITVLTWIHSLYLLGGTLLRKNAFIVSSLLMILCVWLYMWTYRTLGIGTYDVTPQLAGDTVEHTILGPGLGMFIKTFLTLCLALFNYWASFRIFKGVQLITNKYTNYDILKR